jgi:ribosomal protein S18 acetylase RimI-like enzyme
MEHEHAIDVGPATRDELPRVAHFAGQLVRMHHALDPRRYMLREPLEIGYEHFFRSELEDPDAIILAARLKGEVVGYAYGRMEPASWNELREACGAIHDVFVDPPARRHGVAARLLRDLLARLEALGAPRVILLSAFQNTEAQRLFESLGFRKTMVEMTREAGATSKDPRA